MVGEYLYQQYEVFNIREAVLQRHCMTQSPASQHGNLDSQLRPCGTFSVQITHMQDFL
jgi:hypothetical protein